MLVPPNVGAFDAPTTQFEVNDAWLSYLYELVGIAARSSFWQGTEAEKAAAVRNVEAIITAMMVGNIRQTIGEIVIHARDVLPENWLWCDGATYSATDYPELYAAIHPNFRISANSFQVPDLQIRFPYGAPTGSDWIGLQAGEQSHTLTNSEMPVHGHAWQVPNTNVVLNTGATATGLRVQGVAAGGFYLQPAGGQGTATAGGGFAHNNMPPYTFVNYAIVAK